MVNLNVMYGALYIFAAIKWGDWKNWRSYYPTLLFLLVGELLYEFLFFDYSMWEYVPVGSDRKWAKHTHIALLIVAIKYPATILVFLGHLPAKIWKQLLYILLWTVLFSINEYTDLKLGALVHQHGWNMAWSALFSFAMFSILAIHYKNPILAWFFSAAFGTFLWLTFHISTDILK